MTTAITSASGRATISLAPGASEIITLEATAISPGAKGTTKNVVFNVYNSSSDTTVRDAVQAATSTPAIPFDLQIQAGTGTFVGSGTINTNAVDQSISSSVRKTQTATYNIRFVNNKGAGEQFKLKSTGSGSGWTVKYFNAVNADITSAVVAGSWTSPVVATRGAYAVRCTVTPASSVATGSSFAVLATVTALSNGAIKDAVKATSTAIQ